MNDELLDPMARFIIGQVGPELHLYSGEVVEVGFALPELFLETGFVFRTFHGGAAEAMGGGDKPPPVG
jgi:hypothetical protein